MAPRILTAANRAMLHARQQLTGVSLLVLERRLIAPLAVDVHALHTYWQLLEQQV